jgi:hypothetical protein
MIFYKGAVTYSDLETMPLDKIFQLNHYAYKYKNLLDRESKKNGI